MSEPTTPADPPPSDLVAHLLALAEEAAETAMAYLSDITYGLAGLVVAAEEPDDGLAEPR